MTVFTLFFNSFHFKTDEYWIGMHLPQYRRHCFSYKWSSAPLKMVKNDEEGDEDPPDAFQLFVTGLSVSYQIFHNSHPRGLKCNLWSDWWKLFVLKWQTPQIGQRPVLFPAEWPAPSLVFEMTPWTSVPTRINDSPGVCPCWSSLVGLFGSVPVEFSTFQKARRMGNMALIGPEAPSPPLTSVWQWVSPTIPNWGT